MPIPEVEVLNSLVSRVFRIDDFTLGDPVKGTIARYRGHLLSEDSVSAYDQLAESLKPYEIVPLFRLEQGQQVVFLAQKRPDPKPARASVNIVLFILTVLSVTYVGASSFVPMNSIGLPLSIVDTIVKGLPYAASLMAILLSHEFGHYFMSRHHKTAATLPYFIPIPIPPLGTLGAAIFMQGTPKNKRVLFDIGVAGPLAGMIVAIPILLYGLSISKLSINVPPPAGVVLSEQGDSLLYLLAKYLVFGKLLPVPASTHGLSLGMYWLRYFFTGRPFPMGALDVNIDISAIAFAGWAGLLVTALNLIPAGTLDGGHVVYALFGDKAKVLFPYIWGALILLGIFWNGWWLWALLLLWLGRVHAQPLDQITPLDPRRRLVAALVIIVFILTFSPVPFSVFGGL